MATNPSRYAGQSSLSPPLPPRPGAAPTSSQTYPQYVNPAAQSSVSPPLPSRPGTTHSDNYFQCASPSGLSPVSSPSLYSPGAGSNLLSPDAEQKSNWAKRFAGNMLIGRGVRASTTTITSSAKLPINLSPWGDNNPVTLPNVRTRDIFFAGASHFGGDVVVQGLGEVMTFSGNLLQEAISTFTETVIEATVLEPRDRKKAEKLLGEGGLDRVSTEEHVILQTTSVKSVKISIEHKLMGVDADLKLFQTRPCPVLQRGSCAKGWFCPYLYASGRRPIISRADDFAIAQCDGPALEGLVIPVTVQAPILAWSPWTLRQMHDKKFNPGEQYAEIFRYLDSIINLQAVDQLKKESYKLFMAKGIKLIIMGAIEAKEVEDWEMIDPERAGIMMLRY